MEYCLKVLYRVGNYNYNSSQSCSNFCRGLQLLTQRARQILFMNQRNVYFFMILSRSSRFCMRPKFKPLHSQLIHYNVISDSNKGEQVFPSGDAMKLKKAFVLSKKAQPSKTESVNEFRCSATSWRVRLAESEVLLIRFCSEDVVLISNPWQSFYIKPTGQKQLTVIYLIQTLLRVLTYRKKLHFPKVQYHRRCQVG